MIIRVLVEGRKNKKVSTTNAKKLRCVKTVREAGERSLGGNKKQAVRSVPKVARYSCYGASVVAGF